MAADPNAVPADENKGEDEARKCLLDEILQNKAMCEESRKILQDPNVVFIIRRSKNQNIVVYRVMIIFVILKYIENEKSAIENNK